MKKIKYILILIIGLFISINVNANEISRINMDIRVDSNGTAHITETWVANTSSGTEGYKPYYNFGEARFNNFRVSMNGEAFTTIDNWNPNASFEDKAFKSSIINIPNGLELVFGISRFGRNTYILEYQIEGFVVRLNDADMIYWTLMPHDFIEPNQVNIKIYSDFRYDDNWDIWAYGYYGGYAYFYDGYIEMSTNGRLGNDQYMVALVKFPLETFNTNHIIDNDFNYYFKMAEEGAHHYQQDENFWFMLPIIFAFTFGIIGTVIGMTAKNNKKIGTKNLRIDKDIKNLKNVQYFRDIPCDKDIFRAYWVSANFNLIRNKTDFLGALLLKWLKEDRVKSIKVQSRWLKKEETAIEFLNKEGLEGKELEMYDKMVKAAGDNILESNEFRKYCEKNYTKVLKWFDQAIDDETYKLIEEGMITTEEKKSLFKAKQYNVNSRIRVDAERMAGLRKFLKDFSNIKTREAIEVKHWDYYLIYAQIFGMAKKVAEDFKKLYPDVIPEEYYTNMIFIHTFSHNGMRAASTAQARAQSYSGGGGGFASGGGGGGSFGGGGGGGGFR